MMLIPSMVKLNNPELLRSASCLDAFGRLALSASKLIYLDIDDAYIHHLFPLLNNTEIKKPDYFKEGSVGAHITVAYPEEQSIFDKKDYGKEYHFKVKELVVADINLKKYYVLLVESPMLRQLRTKHGLPEQLNFKQHLIDFHITIGVSGKI
ncbi:hypothetical protein [uncultured Legionella sp.]|uniref:hypothetical protein n=1 Tax=uncultured Legionella sp. TaxID=210934 RepID=UPI002628F2DB|nr:hypothetical protein [uncultured Legionella sp.]